MAYKGFPVASYFFDVRIGGLTIGFQSVAGLKATAEYNKSPSGNEGGDTNKVLKKMNYDAVTFKKGLVKGHSMAMEVFNEFGLKFHDDGHNQKINYKNIHITLKSEDDKPLFEWILVRAYPESWEVASFDAMKNELSIETMSFNFKSMKMKQY